MKSVLATGIPGLITGIWITRYQIDRTELKNKYKKIYMYLNEIKEGVLEYEPKKICEYEKYRRNFHISDLEKMKRNGDYIGIDEKIFKKVLKIQNDYISYSKYYYNCIEKSYNIVLKKFRMMYDVYPNENEICNYATLASAEYNIGQNCRTLKNLEELILTDKLEKNIKLLKSMKKKGNDVWVIIDKYDEYTKEIRMINHIDDVIDYMKICHDEFKKYNEINMLEAKRKQLSNDIEEMEKILIKKIKNPKKWTRLK